MELAVPAVPRKIHASGKVKWSIYTDFQKLNEIAVGDNYPLANIQVIIIRKGMIFYCSCT
jgi:hypothetical protein